MSYIDLGALQNIIINGTIDYSAEDQGYYLIHNKSIFTTIYNIVICPNYTYTLCEPLQIIYDNNEFYCIQSQYHMINVCDKEWNVSNDFYNKMESRSEAQYIGSIIEEIKYQLYLYKETLSQKRINTLINSNTTKDSIISKLENTNNYLKQENSNKDTINSYNEIKLNTLKQRVIERTAICDYIINNSNPKLIDCLEEI